MPEIANFEEQTRLKTKLHFGTKLRAINLQHSMQVKSTNVTKLDEHLLTN